MILKRLHLVDNQRPLHLRRILTAEGTIDLPPNIKRPIARWNYSALDLNAELVRFIFSESLPTWDLNFKPVFGLAIGELQHLALDMSPIELLRAVTDFVSESVMPEFMPFFPSCG